MVDGIEKQEAIGHGKTVVASFVRDPDKFSGLDLAAWSIVPRGPVDGEEEWSSDLVV
jgi:hypothetical protein